MSKRKVFNVAYFIASVAVFSWLLRDDPHWRTLPILSVLAIGAYGFLGLVALMKPNGFAVSHAVLGEEQQRRYRRWALLIPVPAIVYMAVYSACVQYAGQAPCLNKFYGPIAKIERAAFSRSRMLDFYHKTHPQLLTAAMACESKQDWAQAESYYRAVTSLENRLCHKKRPSSYAILACLYQRMGNSEKAERYFLKAEQVANRHCKYHQKSCKHGEIVSVGHALKDMATLSTVDIAVDHPWLSSYVQLKGAPAAQLGRKFVALADSDSVKNAKHDHSWCTSHRCLKAACDNEDEQCEHPRRCLTHSLFYKHDCDKEDCKDECKDHQRMLQLGLSHQCKSKDCRDKDHANRLTIPNCKDEECDNKDHDHKVVLCPQHNCKDEECKDKEHDQLRNPQLKSLQLTSI